MIKVMSYVGGFAFIAYELKTSAQIEWQNLETNDKTVDIKLFQPFAVPAADLAFSAKF